MEIYSLFPQALWDFLQVYSQNCKQSLKGVIISLFTDTIYFFVN